MREEQIKFGNRIKELRISKGLLQKEVSQDMGYEFNIAFEIEHASRKIDHKIIEELSKGLKESVDSLIKIAQATGLNLKSRATDDEVQTKEIGKRIAAAREHLHIKQADLAKQIGVSRSNMNRIEEGKSRPKLEVSLPLVRILFEEYPEESAIYYLFYGGSLGETKKQIGLAKRKLKDLQERVKLLENELAECRGEKEGAN